MTTPMDGARNMPLADAAIDEETRQDVNQEDRITGDDTGGRDPDPLVGGDGRRDEERSLADRDEAERYDQDDSSGAPLDAQDDPDVISLDEQGGTQGDDLH